MPGKFYEDLAVGMRIQHPTGRTLSEMDNVLFSSLTMNPQPLHLDEVFAAQTEFGRRIVNGIFTLGLVVGLTVADLTQGTIIANLGYEQVKHPRPMFHGDTLTVVTDVLAKRESKSRPDCGIVTLKHYGSNQHGEICIEVQRAVLFRKRP